MDELEPLASAGGIILDWHTCEAFPERWADLVVVLRCNHTQLWKRLEKRSALECSYDHTADTCFTCRGYFLKKIQENNEAEIMQVVLEEARASYAEEIIVELKSETMEDLEANVTRMVEWVKAWKASQDASTSGDANGP